jgi:hypothetical protein
MPQSIVSFSSIPKFELRIPVHATIQEAFTSNISLPIALRCCTEGRPRSKVRLRCEAFAKPEAGSLMVQLRLGSPIVSDYFGKVQGHFLPTEHLDLIN